MLILIRNIQWVQNLAGKFSFVCSCIHLWRKKNSKTIKLIKGIDLSTNIKSLKSKEKITNYKIQVKGENIALFFFTTKEFMQIKKKIGIISCHCLKIKMLKNEENTKNKFYLKFKSSFIFVKTH